MGKAKNNPDEEKKSDFKSTDMKNDALREKARLRLEKQKLAAKTEKQNLSAEIDRLADGIQKEAESLEKFSKEERTNCEEMLAEFEAAILNLRGDLEGLQFENEIVNTRKKMVVHKNKLADLKEVAGGIFKAIKEARNKSNGTVDKIEEPPATEPVEPPVEPVLPVVDTAPTPPAPDKKELNKKTPEKFTLTKEGVVHLGDKTIDLSPLQASGHYDISINENGTVRVGDKDYPDTKARFQFDAEGKYIAYQQVSRGRDSGVVSLNAGQVEDKLRALFPELREDTGEMSFDGGVLKTPNFSLDLNSLLDGGKCVVEMKGGILCVDGKDQLADMRAKVVLNGKKDGLDIRIMKNDKVVIDQVDYLPSHAEVRLKNTFKTSEVKKVDSITTKKPAPAEEKKPHMDDKKEGPPAERKDGTIENFSQDKLQQLAELLEETGNEEMVNWASSLRVGLPETGNESDELKGKRKLYAKKLFGPEDDIVKSTLDRVVNYFKKHFSDSSLDRTAAFREIIGDKQSIDAYLRIVDLLGVKKEKGFSPEVEARHTKLKTTADNLYTRVKQLLFDINNIRIDKSGQVATEHPPYVGKDEVPEKSRVKITDYDKTEIKQYDDLKNKTDGLAKDIMLVCGDIDRVVADTDFASTEKEAEQKVAEFQAALAVLVNEFSDIGSGRKNMKTDTADSDIPVELGAPEEVAAETPEQKIREIRDKFLAETSEKYLGFKDEIAAYKILHPEAVTDGDDQVDVIRVKVAGAVADAKSIIEPEGVKKYFDEQNAEIDDLIKEFRRQRRKKFTENLDPISSAATAEEATYAPESMAQTQSEAPVEDLLERFDAVKADEVQRRNEILRDLHIKLSRSRENLANAFAEKEKAGGFVGSFKKMFGSKERETAEARFNFAWNEYSSLQQELLETSQKQADELADFLRMESAELQHSIGELYKSKENFASKSWRKLGDFNLHNFLERKGAEAKQKTEQGEALGRWDSFWANRAEEYTKSHTLFKIGAKVISARTAISLGLLGSGIFGVTGAAEARGAFVAVGAAAGSRQIQDAVQNKMQRWLGNRGEFYGTRAEAEEALRAKYGIVEKHFDDDAAVDEPEDKKTVRRRKKFEKELAAVSEKVSAKDKLPVAEQLAKIQEKIEAVQAYAYVNGLDLNKDANYLRLIVERDKLLDATFVERTKVVGDTRAAIQAEALAIWNSRKAELDKTAGKISAEKRLRWGKRIISVAVGATAGTFAYFATLSRAAAFGHGPKEAAVGAVAGKTTEYGTMPASHEAAPVPGSQSLEASMGEQTVPDKFFVHKGDGLERVLQRQLLDDPQKYGYTSEMGDVKHWAGHEASVIAQKQGIADKYFIYNEKNPQYLVLNEDKTVTSIGRLHDQSEIIAAKARAAAEAAQESPEKATPVREVIDAKTGEPKYMTPAEKSEVDKLWDQGKLSEGMQQLMDAKARGPIYELADGTQVHRADIASWDGDVPDIKVSSGAAIHNNYLASDSIYIADSPNHEISLEFKTIAVTTDGQPVMAPVYELSQEVAQAKDYAEALSQANPQSAEYRGIANALVDRFHHIEAAGGKPEDYFDSGTVKKIRSFGGYLRENQPVEAVETPKAAPGVLETVLAESEHKPLNSFDSRYGRMDFSYVKDGEVATDFKIESTASNFPSETEAAKQILKTPLNGELSKHAAAKLADAAAYENIYKDMVAKGLGETSEGHLVKTQVEWASRALAEDLGKKPGELFSDEYLRTYNMKDEIVSGGEMTDEEALKFLGAV